MILLWACIETQIAITAFGGSSVLTEPGVDKLEQTQRGRESSIPGAE